MNQSVKEVAVAPPVPPKAEWAEIPLKVADPVERTLVRWPEELPAPIPPLRLLPDQHPDKEPRLKRVTFLVLAMFLTVGFFYFICSFWAPAHPGVDQNGYLVGGKQLALTGSTGLKPTHPLQYVGAMFVMPTTAPSEASEVWYYPKYPIGLPLLNAIPLWINWERGKDWAYLISPLSTSLSLLAMFLLVRGVAGSFMGLLGLLLLGVNATTMALANNPNSHAPDLFFVIWGMFFLLRWWQTASIWRGILAGFLLGYAVTIRYTEGLLVLPLAVAMVSMIRYRELFRDGFLRAVGRLLRVSVPALAWAIPVLWLANFNWKHMHKLTGYDTTNESSGFSLLNFSTKWEFMVQQLYDFGLFLLFPMAILGLSIIWRSSVRLGLFIGLWLVPGALLYAAYYWGNEIRGTAYLRFFLTIIPAMILSATWFLRHGGWRNHEEAIDSTKVHGSIAMPIACGLLVAVSCAMALKNTLPLMERESAGNVNLAFTGEQITRVIPRGSVVFTSANNGLLNYIQWKGDYDLYPAEAFDSRLLFGLLAGLVDNGQAQPLQWSREKYLQNTVYKNKMAADLVAEQNKVMREALTDSRVPRHVYAVLENESAFRTRFLGTKEFAAKKVAAWKDLATVLMDPGTSPMAPPRGFFQNRMTQWSILEITIAPPAESLPSTMPTTQPEIAITQ